MGDIPTLRLKRFRLSPLLSLAVLFALSTTVPAVAQDKGATSGATPEAVAEPSTCVITFSDVFPLDYYYEPVRYLHCMGAISGYPDNTFRPGANATRGQLSKIVVVAQGWPLVVPPTPSFSDVPTHSSFYPYVETARAHNVIGGYPDGTFRPNSNITRGQLTKVVVLAQAWPLYNPPVATFLDVPAGSIFYGYVETGVQRGIISGYPDRTFRPGANASRGQIAKIVHSAIISSRLTDEERQTVDLINARRVAMGRAPLVVNLQLTAAARRHSNDIGPRGICSHTGTDGSSPWDRIAQAGYTGFGSGEVVGCNYNSPQSVVDAWWGSPGHYDILTDPANNEIGCGWWIGPNGYGWQTCDTGIR